MDQNTGCAFIPGSTSEEAELQQPVPAAVKELMLQQQVNPDRQIFLYVLNCSVVPSLWNAELLQAWLSFLCKSPE